MSAFSNPFGAKYGSDATKRDTGRSMITHKAEVIFLGEKSTNKGRIMPAFDPQFRPGTPEHATGFIPFADPKPDDNGKFTLTPWSIKLKIYRFFGNQSVDFVSPGEDDMVEAAIRALKDVPEARPYIKAKDERNMTKGNRKLEFPRQVVFINWFDMAGDGKSSVKLLGMSQMGFAHITYEKNMLMMRPSVVAAPYDDRFPYLLYGDVTDPARGLLAHAYEDTVGVTKTVGLKFTSAAAVNPMNPTEGLQVLDVTRHLAARHDFVNDPTGVFRLLTRQETADLLVNSGMLPLELIKRAIGAMVDLPQGMRPTGLPSGFSTGAGPAAQTPPTDAPKTPVFGGAEAPKTPVFGSAPAAGDAPTKGYGVPAAALAGVTMPPPPSTPTTTMPPPPSVASMPPPPPAAAMPPPPVVAEPAEWFVFDTATNAVTGPFTRSAVLNNPAFTPSTMVAHDSDKAWKTALVAGLVQPSKPATPAVPAAPSLPPAPVNTPMAFGGNTGEVDLSEVISPASITLGLGDTAMTTGPHAATLRNYAELFAKAQEGELTPAQLVEFNQLVPLVQKIMTQA